MCLTLPEVLISVVGIEKVVATWADLDPLLRLLPRSSTGERMNPYTSTWSGVTPGDGPQEVHVVLLDNGRTRALADDVGRQALRCIRCSACLNVCPVYERVGGHAYGSVYPGPMGSVLSCLLEDLAPGPDLAQASTLCGLCRQECPLGIDLPGLLLGLRQAGTEAAPAANLLPGLAAQVLSRRGLFDVVCRLAPAGIKVLEKLPEALRPPGPWREWRAGGRALPNAPGHPWLARQPREDGHD
jgi:L-lactate dehydrogenase complex protein LldF